MFEVEVKVKLIN